MDWIGGMEAGRNFGGFNRFDAKRFLNRLRGKRLVFVGDSINRNQWVSMVCMVESLIPTHKKSLGLDGSSLLFFNAEVIYIR